MAKDPTARREHKATYATDKRNGGYLIRVAGPKANMFAGRVVPVTMKNDDEHVEELDRLIWSGKDQESGENVALYKFKPRPREETETDF
jgi:hypothetical protein